MNLGQIERFTCVGLGAVLLAAAVDRGMRRVRPGAVAMALAGGALVSRGIGGYCPVYDALDIDTRQLYGPA